MRVDSDGRSPENVRQMYCLASQNVNIGRSWPDWETKVKRSKSTDSWYKEETDEILLGIHFWRGSGSSVGKCLGATGGLEELLARIIHEGMHAGQTSESRKRTADEQGALGAGPPGPTRLALDAEAEAAAARLLPGIIRFCGGDDICPGGVCRWNPEAY